MPPTIVAMRRSWKQLCQEYRDWHPRPVREGNACRELTVESARGAARTIPAMRRVLITAGASGIGREMARAFSRDGAAVAVLDIDGPALAGLRTELPSLVVATCDLADRTQIERTLPQLIDKLGGLDVLVNNAGIAGATAPLEQVKPEDWDRVLRVNLGGTFDVTRLAIPALKRSKRGCIINMSSAAGRLGYPHRSAYATSKWGIVGLTKTLSMELGAFGIRVNAILPGPVAGERMQRVLEGRAAQSGRSLDEERGSALANQSLRYFTEPGEIAAMALFLASEAAQTISGQAISIDGDMHRSV
jgi:NAD(P)-dependent dehydrogenase (short-subunit alcohol dehydrogenase family)